MGAQVTEAGAKAGAEEAPSSLWDKLKGLVVVILVIVTAIPTSVFIPLPLTQLFTRRFEREDLLRRLHLMVPWGRMVVRRILGVRLEVRGREHLPRPSRGFMYICNHQSNVDIPVLIAALGTVAFLSKKLVKRIPFIGRCAYCAGTVYFSRSNKTERARALGETLRMCRRSTAVVVFPEGTRRPTGEIKDRVHPRSLEACHRQGLSVVPVGLDGTWRVLNKAMDRLRRGEPVVVNIGEALDPGDFSNPESFAEACWERVKELHGESRRELMERMGS